MATLSVTPAVDRWAYQTDAFSIVFKAYDDNGEICRNEQLSIQYVMSYDDTMPDPTQMQRVYSDASGLIPLVIIKPCVINIYAIWAHDVNDPSKGEIVQELVRNYKINFQPIIQAMYASYTGPDVEVSDKFDATYLSIKAELSNGTIKTIPASDCIIKDYQITEIGPNTKYATYTDTVLDMVWELDFVVNGISKLLSIEAYYQGERRIIGDRIYPKEVVVYGTFLIATDTTEKQELSETQWYFIDIPIITDANKGLFRVGYKKQESIIKVEYDKALSLQLNVWYEGDKIEVGNSYSPDNVIIYLVYPDGERRRISWRHCQIDSYLVSEEGWNWYTVTYTTEFQQIKQEFPIEGIIYKDYVDLDFKVLYIIDKENQEDLTDIFTKELEQDECFLFDWKIFLETVNKISKYGLYIVTVPKAIGLSNKYDMDWEVLCINETTLKADIKKIYNEED